MSHTILLYGATGFSGRLIAEEAASLGMNDPARKPECRLLLAGRNGPEVAKLASQHGMDHRAFDIRDRETVIAGLDDVDVVINAAGPFALTANHLAMGALAKGCHYVDVNAEAEVYMQLDDLGHHASKRECAMVVSAGHSAAASDVLLDVALQELRAASGSSPEPLELGSIRLAFSEVGSLSRGSLETLSRALREQVRIVRRSGEQDAKDRPRHVLWHEPVGRIERSFDFADPFAHTAPDRVRHSSDDRRIASAVNAVDTLTARLTAERRGVEVHRIETYLEVGGLSRLVYQLGPLMTPLAGMPLARDLVRLQFSAFPDGPTPEERNRESHLIVLEIEDPLQRRAIHWAWHTPNSYTVTARLVLEVAQKVAGTPVYGWLTPAEVLAPVKADLNATTGYLRGCRLIDRDVVKRVA
jgi:short subunit dehydrogenase-like uncharacterized protein